MNNDANQDSTQQGHSTQKRLANRLSIATPANTVVSALSPELRVFDYIQASTNGAFDKVLRKEQEKTKDETKERIMFSTNVTKINKDEKHQKRTFIMTDRAVYNFKKGRLNDYQRRIPLVCLRGLVLSRQSEEIVFQVRNDYDYRYLLPHRQDLLKLASHCFLTLTGTSLPVFLADEADLRSFMMTKAEWESASPEQKILKSQNSALSSPLSPNPHDSEVVENTSTAQRLARSFHGSVMRKIGLSPSASKESMTSTEPAVMEGWLTHSSGRSSKWSLRYAILRDKILTIFRPRVKGTLSTDQCQAKSATQMSAEENSTDKRGQMHKRSSSEHTHLFSRWKSRTGGSPPYVLCIDAPSRTKELMVGSSDAKALEEWEQAFTKSGRGDQTAKKEGWLLKQDPRSKSWRRRYFVLSNDRCWYFEMTYQSEIQWAKSGELTSAPISVEPTLSAAARSASGPLDVLSQSNFSYRFRLSHNDTPHTFAADSDEDRKAWLNTLQTLSLRHSRDSSADPQLYENIPQEFLDGVNQVAPEGEVTFVFSDVQSSTSLWEAVPDAMDEALETHDSLFRSLLKDYEGYEVKTEGDAFMVAFNTAIGAVRWCCAVQRALCHSEWPQDILEMEDAKHVVNENGETVFRGIRVRMGIHTGTPNLRRNPVTKRMDYFGPCVNLAARVSDTAHGGQIVATQIVHNYIAKAQPNDASIPTSTVLPGRYLLKGIRSSQLIYNVVDPELQARADVFPLLRAKLASEDANDEVQEFEEDEISSMVSDLTQSDSDSSSLYGGRTSEAPSALAGGIIHEEDEDGDSEEYPYEKDPPRTVQAFTRMHSIKGGDSEDYDEIQSVMNV